MYNLFPLICKHQCLIHINLQKDRISLSLKNLTKAVQDLSLCLFGVFFLPFFLEIIPLYYFFD